MDFTPPTNASPPRYPEFYMTDPAGSQDGCVFAVISHLGVKSAVFSQRIEKLFSSIMVMLKMLDDYVFCLDSFGIWKASS